MRKHSVSLLLILAGSFGLVAADCPNACSGNGDCTSYEQCDCYRNWFGGDCSERLCPFGMAHIDSPKGDLDFSSGDLSGPDTTVIVNSQIWPAGTTELYPATEDSAGNVLKNTAHEYRECSNKGLCDRGTGLCQCFVGYEGSSCQRASCPRDCSGNGVCKTLSEIAADNYDNEYNLWDKDTTMGCECDAGYYGADCSLRYCPYGVDPLYLDDSAFTKRNPTWHFRITDDASAGVSGTFALKFYDVFGEDYVTDPIVWDSSTYTSCSAITDALEALPNSVIESGTVVCTSGAGGPSYTLEFEGNPGDLRQIEIDQYLDGSRSTLTSTGNVLLDVWQEGISGEFTDYFSTLCEDVEVTATTLTSGAAPGKVATLSFVDVNGDGSTADEIKLFKICLGDSNGVSSDNVDVENWDRFEVVERGDGTNLTIPSNYPHAIKMVPTSPTSSNEGGYFHLLWYESDTATFYLMNRANSTSTYNVFVTDGVAQFVFDDLDSSGYFTKYHDEPAVSARWAEYDDEVYMSRDAACDTAASTISGCLEKGDLIMLPDANWGDHTNTSASNYMYGDFGYLTDASSTAHNTGNMFEITKIWTADYSATTHHIEDRYRLTLDKNLGWDGSATGQLQTGANVGTVWMFKFTPASTGNYEYVSECANRGVCDETEGVCNCFDGYTNYNCDTQSALARMSTKSSGSGVRAST